MAIAFKLCFRVCHQEGSVKPGWLEIKWYTPALVYADGVNIWGGSVHTVRENAEAQVVASKEIGIAVNADETKYMIMSGDQNAGRSRNYKD